MTFLAWRTSDDRRTAGRFPAASAADAATWHAELTYSAEKDEAGPVAVTVAELLDDGQEVVTEFNVLVDFEPRFAAELRSKS